MSPGHVLAVNVVAVERHMRRMAAKVVEVYSGNSVSPMRSNGREPVITCSHRADGSRREQQRRNQETLPMSQTDLCGRHGILRQIDVNYTAKTLAENRAFHSSGRPALRKTSKAGCSTGLRSINHLIESLGLRRRASAKAAVALSLSPLNP